MEKNQQRRAPRVTIGLPVFNGERYLRKALDSILNQTYTDFELIISDNASTDSTSLICSEYASRDTRIRYYSNRQNLGAAKNHNLVFHRALGEYFKWAAYDDILAPHFVEECVKILDNNSSVILCHCQTGRINEKGELLDIYEFGLRSTTKTCERFADIISMRNNAWILLLGLVRSTALRKTPLLESYISADRNLLAELSLLGPIHRISGTLFFRREHSQSYTNKSHKNLQEKLGWWSANKGSGLIFPYWRVLEAYRRSVKRSPLNWSERQLCNFEIMKWLMREGWVLMGMDVGLNIMKNKIIYRFFAPIGRQLIQRAGIK